MVPIFCSLGRGTRPAGALLLFTTTLLNVIVEGLQNAIQTAARTPSTSATKVMRTLVRHDQQAPQSGIVPTEGFEECEGRGVRHNARLLCENGYQNTRSEIAYGVSDQRRTSAFVPPIV